MTVILTKLRTRIFGRRSTTSPSCQIPARTKSSRIFGPIVFLVFITIFWAFFIIVCCIYVSAVVVTMICNRIRSRVQGISEKDEELEDLVTEEEAKLYIDTHGRFEELEDLEDLCANIIPPTSSDSLEEEMDSSSETIAADDDPFADPSDMLEDYCPLQLAFFLRRKLDGLSYRPESEYPLRRTFFFPATLPPDSARLIHGGSPLKQAYKPEDFVEEEEEPIVAYRNLGSKLPRLKHFISMPTIHRVKFDPDPQCQDQWKKTHRRARETMMGFITC